MGPRMSQLADATTERGHSVGRPVAKPRETLPLQHVIHHDFWACGASCMEFGPRRRNVGPRARSGRFRVDGPLRRHETAPDEGKSPHRRHAVALTGGPSWTARAEPVMDGSRLRISSPQLGEFLNAIGSPRHKDCPRQDPKVGGGRRRGDDRRREC